MMQTRPHQSPIHHCPSSLTPEPIQQDKGVKFLPLPFTLGKVEATHPADTSWQLSDQAIAASKRICEFRIEQENKEHVFVYVLVWVTNKMIRMLNHTTDVVNN